MYTHMLKAGKHAEQFTSVRLSLFIYLLRIYRQVFNVGYIHDRKHQIQSNVYIKFTLLECFWTAQNN